MTSPKPESASQGPLHIGQVFIWQYEILQLIGSGGHAFVYRARHRFLGHLVAIKVLHRAAGVSLEMLRRGQAEAQIEFQLKHPGIVSVLDAGIDNDGLLYIVMELLQGRSVREAFIELGRLEVSEVLMLGAKVARAMDVAHRAGVVHRDLKPENLFFTRHDNEPKVVDFGIAKIDDAAGWQTQKDMVMGTVYYMSPEQVMAQPVTPRSDIYSLGTILCEALLGQPAVLRQVGGRPFSFKLLTRIIVTEQLPPLNQLDPRIPAYVDQVITKATAKRPEERFASMQEFAEACAACSKAYEAELLQRHGSLPARDLSRQARSTSGVEAIGTPTAAPLDHDTAPTSKPPFFGGLSSSAVTIAPRVATFPLESPQPQPQPQPRPQPQSRPRPAATGPKAPPAAAASRPPLAFLLWGLAAGIVIFGVGAFFVLQSKRQPPPTPARLSAAQTSSSPAKAVLPPSAPAVSMPVAPASSAARATTPPASASTRQVPIATAPQRAPQTSTPKQPAPQSSTPKRPASTTPPRAGKSSIF